jgi:hypothetical protein
MLSEKKRNRALLRLHLWNVCICMFFFWLIWIWEKVSVDRKRILWYRQSIISDLLGFQSQILNWQTIWKDKEKRIALMSYLSRTTTAIYFSSSGISSMFVCEHKDKSYFWPFFLNLRSKTNRILLSYSVMKT